MKRIAILTAALFVLSLPGAGLAAKKHKSKEPDGASLFAENCAYCHGNGGRGDGPSAGKFNPAPADLTKIRAGADEIGGVVRNGKGSCPSWRASLSEEEIAAVASWTKSLQR